MNASRRNLAGEIGQLHGALDELTERLGGLLRLEACGSKDVKASRGVYFFFEDGEARTDSGRGARVVRVGTHGLRRGAASTLWSRLRQHSGDASGAGNQRGSIFRRHVGGALMAAGVIAPVHGWWAAGRATLQQRAAERDVERAVSRAIRRMPFIYLPVRDDPGPGSERGYIERNAVALLSSAEARELDPPSAAWLGRHARAPEISASGLWNVQHIGEPVDAGFIDALRRLVDQV